MGPTFRPRRAKIFFAVMSLLAVLVCACNALLDFEAFKVVSVVDDGGLSNEASTSDGNTANQDGGTGDGGCIDPTGFGGKGCYRCPPQTNEQFLSACTSAKFETFDNHVRIKDFDASDPKPALEDGGPQPPDFDAGPTSSGANVSDAGCPFGNPAYPNPVLVTGATGFPMETIAKAMGSEVTMYFAEKSSCLGVGAAVVNRPLVNDYLVYYDVNNNGTATSCRMAPEFGQSAGQAADVALSGLFPDSCSGTDVGGGNVLPSNTQLPSDWKEYLGPVNPAMFAVPPSSTQKVISAEAGYRVYGFGSGSSALAHGVEPWTDEFFVFRRTRTSATQQAIARALGLPFDALRGVNSTGASAMRKAFTTVPAGKIEATLGISTSEIVDADRSTMRSLAYQHYGQAVGFYPDGDPGQFDRRNVRDGHYFLWIPLHIFARVNGSGDPISSGNAVLEAASGKSRDERDAAVRKLVLVMANRQEAPIKTVDLFGALKRLGDVPQCAMRVTRTKEGADLTSFTPPTSCACAFEAASPGSILAECKPCTQPSDCAGTTRTTCSFGFCE